MLSQLDTQYLIHSLTASTSVIGHIRSSQLIGGSPEIYDQESNQFEDARNNLICQAHMVRRSQVQIDERTY